MGLARSSSYAAPAGPSDAGLVAEMRAITDEFEAYGYRRVGAELRHRGHVVNAKKVRRLMRENDLNPRTKRRFARTTDSDHDGPIFPFVARDYEVHGPNQLWVGDITYVAIATGFVYLTVILDAWSRRVIGHALARNLEARHTVTALARAIALRRPLPGCVFHSDRGAQYASGAHHRLLARHGLTGSMSRITGRRSTICWTGCCRIGSAGSYALSARPKVNSPPAITLENNEKTPTERTSGERVVSGVGGGTGTAVE